MQTLFNGCQDKSMKSKNQEANPRGGRIKEIPNCNSQWSPELEYFESGIGVSR